MIKCWSVELTIAKTVSFLKMQDIPACRQTVAKVFKMLRNICTIALDKNKIKLGGINHIIQIDESLFAKVKYNRGKDLLRNQVWVFGMVDA